MSSHQPSLNDPVPEIVPAAGTISPATAITLAGLFRERVACTPEASAYRYFDPITSTWKDRSWNEMALDVARWQAALEQEQLAPGSRIGIMLRNSLEWVLLHQAALGLGLVVVPLYMEDRADNVEYILRDSGVALLAISGPKTWALIKSRSANFGTVKRIVTFKEIRDLGETRLVNLTDWLPPAGGALQKPAGLADDLATIVYTSGTTGRPKGVMLSHRNILNNAYNGLRSVRVTGSDVFLSFLPLSHMLELTVGYILPMMVGATVAHNRSIAGLAEDLVAVRPTVLICVPRIFERIYARIKHQLDDKPVFLRRLFGLAIETGWRRYEFLQGRGRWHPSFILWPVLNRLIADQVRARFGGNLKAAISGGAALSPRIAKAFIGLGVPILQGYGLTETSPVVSVNRLDNNIPESIGPPLPGVEVKIASDEELLVRGDLVMSGYWNNPRATREMINNEGWLHTGDQARIEGQHLFITGRLKDVIVLANGEKVPPSDMELAIATDPLFEQVMVIGEARPYLTVLTVLNEEQWRRLRSGTNARDENKIEALLLKRISGRLKTFPGYAKIHRVTAIDEPWSVENGLLTPTLKAKRNAIRERYAAEIERMYAGHE